MQRSAKNRVNVLRQAVLRLRLPNKETKHQKLLAGNTREGTRGAYSEHADVSIEGVLKGARDTPSKPISAVR
jgi:hypothetical protein